MTITSCNLLGYDLPVARMKPWTNSILLSLIHMTYSIVIIQRSCVWALDYSTFWGCVCGAVVLLWREHLSVIFCFCARVHWLVCMCVELTFSPSNALYILQRFGANIKPTNCCRFKIGWTRHCSWSRIRCFWPCTALCQCHPSNWQYCKYMSFSRMLPFLTSMYFGFFIWCLWLELCYFCDLQVICKWEFSSVKILWSTFYYNVWGHGLDHVPSLTSWTILHTSSMIGSTYFVYKYVW